MTESIRNAIRLEFYLPAGRRLTLIKRDTWLDLKREVVSRSEKH